MNLIKSLLPGISRVLSSTSPVIILFVLSKFVAVDDIGLLNYFIALITIVGILTDFGLPEAVQKFVVQGKDKIERISFTVFAEIGLVLVGGVIFLLLDWISGYRISFGYSFQIFLLLIFSASNVFILIFNGLKDKFRTGLYYTLSSLIFIGLTFALYFFHITDVINAFLIGRIVGWAVFSIIPVVVLMKEKLIDFSKAKTDSRFLKFAANVLVSTMAYVIMGQWDSILVTNYAGAYENGIYKSVSTIATMPVVLTVILQTKLLPEFSELVHHNKIKELKAELFKYLKLLGGFCIVAFLISIPLAHFGLSLIYNSEIADNGLQYFFPILASVLIYIFTFPVFTVLLSLGYEHLYRNASLIQSVLFLILSTGLIATFGISLLPTLLLLANILFLLINVLSLRFSLKDIERKALK